MRVYSKPIRHFRRFPRIFASILFLLVCASILPAQGAKKTVPENSIPDADSDHVRQRNEWFFRGRLVSGVRSADLRRHAYESKVRMRRQRAASVAAANSSSSASSGSWMPLGPVPLASDATGNGTQDYRQVAGRATAVAIDAADPSGNTIYVGGAQSGVWKSTNAASTNANSVTWTPVTDDQATLSIGAIAIQPGNSDPGKSVILVATGEADNSGDSYFGLGILRSTDAGNTWNLISTANGGTLSFSGLGGTRMAFASTAGQTNTVVAAMATTSEGVVSGAVTSNTTRGLYTSLDVGQTWSYNALIDPGGASDATSATSVVYNAPAGKFLAAIRYHGFYSSPDGVTWTRLANQPGDAMLSTSACPPQSGSNGQACPLYRAEISIVPGRNEIYVWYVSLDFEGNPVDRGIWQSLNAGGSWTQINGSGINNCGDSYGCGVQQGSYNLELLAVANGASTDLYAGAVNLYKCSLTAANPTCTSSPFLNLTHVYGCNPVGAPAHVHPDQHALAYMIPTSGGDSGNILMYFANDGGIYRALNEVAGLSSGACSGTNQFDDLNQNLGSMAQFVSFSQHPSDANTLLGGTQDNGSPATNQATTSSAWINVLGGDGGYNAIDPAAPANFYASNPDIPPEGLVIQRCTSGVQCLDGSFNAVVTSNTVGGDDGAFYFPYMLDPQPPGAMLVGTCRVWRGPKTGGAFTALSPNFDTLGAGICAGNEVNQVRAIAAGGPTDSNGSTVIYATTSGYGPVDGPFYSPVGGRVWVTTDATDGVPKFTDVSNNGPQGSINPNQFPISSVAIDSSDATGSTAYVTIMGFTGGSGHVWKTTNAGVSWIDFTGNLPDAPVNAVLVDAGAANVYVGTDVGVFVSSTSAAGWTELGPNPGTDQPGFLPNVAVTALGLFNSGGQKLLRASTYGRGIWQINLDFTPDFQLVVSNSPLTLFAGQTAVFNGTATALNGYANSVALSCVAGATSPPSTCAIAPPALVPGANTRFTVTVGGAVGDNNFNVQGFGADSNHITHLLPVTLHVVNFGMTAPSPSSVTVPRGTTSSPLNFQVTASGSFNQSVTVSCTPNIPGATCTLTPGTSVNPSSTSPVNMTARVAVPSATAPNAYNVTIQATTAGASSALSSSFALNVTANPDFVISEPSAFPEVNVGSSGVSGPISITSQDGFAGAVTLNCPATYGSGSCGISPTSVTSYPATATLTINGASFTAGGYSVSISGKSGSVTHSVAVPFNVGDYLISGTQTLSLAPGGQGTANVSLTSLSSYSGKINATCDASAVVGANCTISPVNPITVASGGTGNITATVNVSNDAALGNYHIKINTQDTTGAPNHSFTVSVNVGQDFAITASTPSQTVNAGQTSGPYNLTIQPLGSSFNGAVTLACSSLPALAQCLFNPSAPVTPGNSPATVVMTVTTTSKTAALEYRNLFYAVWLLPGIAIVWGTGCSTKNRRVAGLAMFSLLVVFLLILTSCGGASSGGSGGGGGGGHPGTPPGSYKITVTGSSAGTPTDAGQSTQVTLVVN